MKVEAKRRSKAKHNKGAKVVDGKDQLVQQTSYLLPSMNICLEMVRVVEEEEEKEVL